MAGARALFAITLALLGLFLGLGECSFRQKRIVGGVTAPPPPIDDPLVFVRKDDFEARIFGTRDPQTGYYLFRGMRYAEPPVGERRFQRSDPLYMEGVINATKWGPPCPQPGPDGGIIGDEDCLFINVFTPALPAADVGYDVVVFIHGGNFRRGSAAQYEVRNLIKKKVIVVTFQYRLGSLGFLSTGTKDLSGNNGLFDQVLAVEWVRDYIEFFGGNPKKITAVGQGSGASSVFLLGLSKFGKKYFSGIVAMSGSLLSNFAIDKQPIKSVEMLAAEYNCPTNDTVAMVKCVRQLPYEMLVEHDNKQETFLQKAKNFITDLSTLLTPGPVVEGKDDFRFLPNFVTDKPEDAINLLEGLPEIPLLTGVIKDECGGAVYGPFKDTITQALQAFPDFLTKELVPSLQKIVPSVGSVTKQFVPEAFGKYLDPLVNIGGKPGYSKGPADSIAKVAEALNDAIFNVPAFLTVKNWSKKGNAFIYSFDHKSNKGFGKDFLQGMPLVADSAANGKTSHGDDLGYVFEPNTLMGEPMPKKEFDKEDEMVMDFYTDMIVNFARSGEVMIVKKDEETPRPFALTTLQGREDGYISIAPEPKIEEKFRFCEMGLWTGIEERYKSAACSLFFVDIPNPLKTIKKSVSSVSNNLPHFSKAGSVTDFVNTNSLTSSVKLPDLKNLPKPPINVPTAIPNSPVALPTGIPKAPINPPKLPAPSLNNPLSQSRSTKETTSTTPNRRTAVPQQTTTGILGGIPRSPFPFG